MDPILLSAIITAILVILAAILLGWAAESAEKFIAPGLALAILALLQTLPEYTIEAVIAWSRQTHLMVANLTGSLRLLLGFGWPMIFFIAAVRYALKYNPPSPPFSARGGSPPHNRRTGAFGGNKGGGGGIKAHGRLLGSLELSPHQALETLFLIPPVLYFTFIWFKGTMTPIDGIILISMFLWFIKTIAKTKVGPEENIENGDMPAVVQKVVHAPRRQRNLYIFGLFAVGGIVIFLVAHPFVESLKGLAATWGVSEFLFIQWIAPFVSEFPEKTTAFMWAAKVRKATTGMMNMVSSNLNQWTLLAGSLPLIFSISAGEYSTVVFDAHQREEILLTILQTAMILACMWNAKISWWKVMVIFALWLAGFFMPAERTHFIYVHLALVVTILIFSAIRQPVPEIWRRAWIAMTRNNYKP